MQSPTPNLAAYTAMASDQHAMAASCNSKQGGCLLVEGSSALAYYILTRRHISCYSIVAGSVVLVD